MNAPSVLFDAPGPKARVRHRVIAVVSLVVLAGLLALVVRGLSQPANNQFSAEKWQPFLSAETWTSYFIPGIIGTVRAAAVAVVLSLVFGILLGVGRLAPLRPVRIVVGAFVEFFRAVPVLMMMLFGYFFFLYQVGLSGGTLPFAGVVVGLTFYNSCVIAELIRSGVSSLARGQGEAALAIGMTYGQSLRSVLLPQAITAMLPSIVSQLVVILKDSALGYWITYEDLLLQASSLGTAYGNTLPALLVAALIFILLNYGLTRIARLLEVKLLARQGGRRPPTATAEDPMLNPGLAPGAAAAANTAGHVA